MADEVKLCRVCGVVAVWLPFAVWSSSLFSVTLVLLLLSVAGVRSVSFFESWDIGFVDLLVAVSQFLLKNLGLIRLWLS